jgi:hypothetical protein
MTVAERLRLFWWNWARRPIMNAYWDVYWRLHQPDD